MISVIPFFDPNSLGEYQDKIVELYMADAALNQTIPDSIRQPTEWLLRLVNCYYSNKIEGNPTHPKELLKTQESGQAGNQNVTKSVLELLVHLEAQIKSKALSEKIDSVTSQDYIKSIHQSFYNGLPDDMLTVKNKIGDIAFDENGDPIKIVPGEYRNRDVQVGQHIPPDFKEVPSYMKWVAEMFAPKKIHGTTRVIAAAGLHHRLTWIHPFLDGNGRAIRLITDGYMRNAGFGGYGLWSITRGFGRDTSSYYKALARADMARQGASDGRGILSDKGLLDFTKYFIDTALDQVKFFTDLLEPRKLGIRIDYYFEMRAKGGLPDADGKKLPILKIAARDIYRLLLEKGAMSRSAICEHLDKGEQTLRPIIKQMDKEGLISAKPKQDIEIKLSTTAVEFLFPQIW
ncbi:MAG: Fic family protein [Zhongshania sp.]|uniref:Fic family protein n=1 Tax=Zhongshania sp. TaxID=1971902 RepID=UPI00262804AF|nr:Fic family protein [Zhongshania sp.]MDF1692889.1 Fic family protein [Zhongshania sp.]